MCEELKDNMCVISFHCADQNGDCIYFMPKEGSTILNCKYCNDTGYCMSISAGMNRITLMVKGFDKYRNLES